MANISKNKVQEWAATQRGGIIMDLMEFVNIESVSSPECTSPPFGSGCQNALAWMLEKGKSFGLQGCDYDHYAGSLSLHGEEKTNPEQVTGIWCHLDVVPAGEGWHTPPYQAQYRDGLITGRGAQDNKSAAILGLYVLKGLQELDISLSRPAALYFGISEECGMQDLDYFLSHFSAPGLSLIADCGFPACYGEKGSYVIRITGKDQTDYDVCDLNAGIAHNIIPDYVSARIQTREKSHMLSAVGTSGHSAFPTGSKNAIPAFLEQLFTLPGIKSDCQSLHAIYALALSCDGAPAGICFKDPEFGDLTCCVTRLYWDKGIWQADLDIRYPHSVDPDTIFAKLFAYAGEHNCSIETVSHLPSFGFSKEHPIIQKLTEVYNRETHCSSEAYAMAGGTYAAKLPNAIPFGIAFPDKSMIYDRFPKGHGDYHQPDESVIVDQIIDALVIYLLALIEIDSLPID